MHLLNVTDKSPGETGRGAAGERAQVLDECDTFTIPLQKCCCCALRCLASRSTPQEIRLSSSRTTCRRDPVLPSTAGMPRSPGFAAISKPLPLGRRCRGKTRSVPAGFHGRQILSSRHRLPNQAETDKRVWQLPPRGLARPHRKNRTSSGPSMLLHPCRYRWSTIWSA